MFVLVFVFGCGPYGLLAIDEVVK